jgi:predicted nucleic acid-binding protein
VRAEAEAVENIMRMVRQNLATWVSSTVLNIEVSRNPDPDRRRDAEALLAFATEIVMPKRSEADRARRIEKLGFDPFDALHLASAEQGGAGVFLTTDDGLLRRANGMPVCFTSKSRTLYRGIWKCNHDLHRQND